VLAGGGVALTIARPSSSGARRRSAARVLGRRAGRLPAAARAEPRPQPDAARRSRHDAAAVAGEAWTPRRRRCGLYALVAAAAAPARRERELPADTLAWFDRRPASLAFHPDGADIRPCPGWWLAAGAEEPHA
jgi:hypothetical protein